MEFHGTNESVCHYHLAKAVRGIFEGALSYKYLWLFGWEVLFFQEVFVSDVFSYGRSWMK